MLIFNLTPKIAMPNKRILKRMLIVLGIISAFYWLLYLSLYRDIFIINEGFEGCVLVVFDVKGTSKKKYDTHHNRIYEIPESGILETEFNQRYGIKLPEKYYMRNNKGKLTRLRYIFPGGWNESNPTSEFVISTYEYGVSYKPWLSFVVSKYNSDESICEKRNLEHFEYLEKFNISK